jgi:membrane fusion protein (multidrug efflux system)
VRTSSIVAGVALFGVLGLGAGGLWLWKRSDIAKAANAPQMEPPTAVKLEPARTTLWAPMSDLVGTVVALRSVTVKNEVEGVVRKVGFDSGAIVEQGQVLVQLDDSTDRAELRSAEATLRVAEADVAVVEARIRLTEAEYRRQEAALTSRATSAMEVDRARAEMEKATAERARNIASVDEARARIQRVQTRLEKHTIRAPFRARAGIRTVHEGQFLPQQMGMGGNDAIVTLQEVADTIFIDFAIPQEFLSRIGTGTKVSGALDATGSMGSGATEIQLVVAAIDASVNNQTRNVRVRAVVDNREGKLRAGMFVKVRVPVEEPKPYVVIPVTAVRKATYADQVFTVKTVSEGPEGKKTDVMRAVQKFVTLGPVIGSDVIVLKGVSEGEIIASSGSFKLREGALVMPAADAGQPGPGSGGPGNPAQAPSLGNDKSSNEKPVEPAKTM